MKFVRSFCQSPNITWHSADPYCTCLFDSRSRRHTVDSDSAAAVCSNRKFHHVCIRRNMEDADLWPFQVGFTLKTDKQTKWDSSSEKRRKIISLSLFKAQMASSICLCFPPEGLSGRGSAGFLKRSCSPASLRQGCRSCRHDWLWWWRFPGEGRKVLLINTVISFYWLIVCVEWRRCSDPLLQ